MALNFDGLKTAVDDIVKAAESVGADLVNQESGIAQEDVDALTNALQGAHAKIAPTATAAPPAPDAAAPPAADAAAAGEGTGSAGAGAWTPPPAAEGAGS